MSETELLRTADAPDAFVGLLGGEAGEGQLDALTLLLIQVIVSATESVSQLIPSRSRLSILNHNHHHHLFLPLVTQLFLEHPGAVLPETHLAVAGGARVPLGDGHEHVLQPRPLPDEGRERGVGSHGG